MQTGFQDTERTAAAQLIQLALDEDLRHEGDLTCQALIDENESGEIHVVARQSGVLAGTPVAQMLCETLNPSIHFNVLLRDGSTLKPGSVIGTLSGPLRPLLTGERTALNFLTHLSGVATLTRKFVAAVSSTRAKILDTRKTLPGWRVLEKYAVRVAGADNHRMGLYDGILIKDNHLAAWTKSNRAATIADAVRQARDRSPAGLPVEVEVDTLDQLTDALAGRPDIVLLDNMNGQQLRQAVELRDRLAREVLLEASGGITLDNVAEIGRTGVDRISVGALTHSAVALDLAFDWK